MTVRNLTLSVCVLFACCFASFGQTPIPTPIPLGPQLPTPVPLGPQPSGPQQQYPRGQPIIVRPRIPHQDPVRQAMGIGAAGRSEPRVLKSGMMAPSADDVASYKSFLAQKNTGLIRLLPRGAYKSKLRGDGAYYSFFSLSHEYGWGSDISLELGLISPRLDWADSGILAKIGDFISTGFAGADYGILTNIGDVALDSLDLTDPRTLYLATYKPPSKEADAREEFRKATVGFTDNGLLYRRIALAQVNSSYLLRSINYDRSDVLVALRVVRIDDDDSAIIAWKLLKKYSTPTLSR